MESFRQAPLLLTLLLSLLSTYTSFTPDVANYIDCGAKTSITLSNDSPPRTFIADNDSILLSGESTIPLSNPNNFSSGSLYSTARVSSSIFTYTFNNMQTNTSNVLRLHFLPFSAPSYDLSTAKFSVQALNRYILLENFTFSDTVSPTIKEFFLWTDSNKLEVQFIPQINSIAFVSAIEAFTAPPEMLNRSSPISIGNTTINALLVNQALETVYRVNMPGPLITPKNDTLWRTWVTDGPYIYKADGAQNKSLSKSLNYYPSQGSSEEIAPQAVYNTARTLNFSKDFISNPAFNINITWSFSVDSGYQYLIRLHFCDIISDTNNSDQGLVFTVHIMDYLGEGYLAKLSDFGLSQLGASIGETHFSTAVKGTFGYLDPEYLKTKKLTDKSDVYSFGVTLLEVLCARPVIDQSLAIEEINLAEWALMCLRRDQLEKLIDPKLVEAISENSLKKFGEIAEKCLQENGMDRPAIGDVLLNLEYCLHLQETEVGREPFEDGGTSEAHFPVIPFVRRIPSSVVSHGTAATSGNSSYDNNEGSTLDSSSSAAGRKLKHIVVSIKKRLQKRTPNVKETHLLWSPMREGVNSIDKSRKSGGTTNGWLISFAQILMATNNFDENNVLGMGGFGKVYRGVLSNGVEVAVKRGDRLSNQGIREFQVEILFLSHIRHRHLVSLIGYCEECSELILVYEYMEKGPLRSYLYGSQLPSVSWKQRLEICIGAAKGLHYLHTGYSQTIIHRDIKSSNILLGDGYLAKLSDFGLSLLGPSIGERHVSTVVKGSLGYLDPEYFMRQQITHKSDVYSFGVVLLEVLCGRPPIVTSVPKEEVNLATWALMWLRRDQLEKIIDPRLVGEINENSVNKFGEIAVKCLQDYGMDRPEIGDVLCNLEYCLHLQETEVRREPYEDSSTSEAHFPVIPSSVVSHGTAATSGDSRVENNEGIELDSSCSAAGRKLKQI